MSEQNGTISAAPQLVPAAAGGSGSGSVETAGSPAEFLKNVVGKQVRVRIQSGIDYQGNLSCLDGYMNVAMESTTELVDGQVKASFGDAFIRGNNVLYISAMEEI